METVDGPLACLLCCCWSCLFTCLLLLLHLECFLLFLVLGAAQQLDDRLSIDHALLVDGELAEGIVDFLGGELLSPGHQRVSQPVNIRQCWVTKFRRLNWNFNLCSHYLTISPVWLIRFVWVCLHFSLILILYTSGNSFFFKNVTTCVSRQFSCLMSWKVIVLMYSYVALVLGKVSVRLWFCCFHWSQIKNELVLHHSLTNCLLKLTYVVFDIVFKQVERVHKDTLSVIIFFCTIISVSKVCNFQIFLLY